MMKRRYLASTFSIMTLLAGSTVNNAYAVTYTPATKNIPLSQATGGPSRGNFFIPPSKKAAPKQATGGASRGNLFTPSSGKGAPRQATGGASRGNVFTPSAGKGAPRQATGGASRGNVFTPSAGKGAPRQATGGASRGNVFTASSVETEKLSPATVAAAGPAALIPLLPETFYGTTVSERPTILVYLPASNAEEAVFSLKDEAGNMLYQMTIPIGGKIGVIPVKLPADAPPLAIGKNYQWFLAVKIDGELSPSTPYVDGWIERIQPNAELAKAMQQEDALVRAAAFGQHGVWYDCVATLAGLHSSQPTNVTLTNQWQELLSSVSLNDIMTAKLVLSAN